jgi:probable HAF family extracellular repeat protein
MPCKFKFPHFVSQINHRLAQIVFVMSLTALFTAPLMAQGRGNGGGGSSPPPIQFEIELLTTPTGSPDFGGSQGQGMANDINESGIIVGSASATAPHVTAFAYVWMPTTGMVDLNTLLQPADRTVWTLRSGNAINDSNVICGSGYNTVAGRTRGFRMDLGTGAIEEMADDSGSYVSAEDLNNLDEVVGFLGVDGIGSVGGFWTESNQKVFVDPGSNGPNGVVLSINDSGAMVGYSGPTGSGEHRALLWNSSNSAPIDLGWFALGKDNLPDSKAFAINGNGTVVGFSSAGKYKLQGSWYTVRHAFVWTSATGLRDIGTLGAKNSEARAVNDRGDVVGTTDNGPFFYSTATGMFDLKSAISNLPSGIQVMNVVNINESREIVGNCVFRNDTRVWSIVLRPVNP